MADQVSSEPFPLESKEPNDALRQITEKRVEENQCGKPLGMSIQVIINVTNEMTPEHLKELIKAASEATKNEQ